MVPHSWLSGDLKSSDLRLQLRTSVQQPADPEEEAQCLPHKSKAARRQEGSTSAPDAIAAELHDTLHGSGRSYDLHGGVLASASAYFKTRMTKGWYPGGSGGNRSTTAYANTNAVAGAHAQKTGTVNPLWTLVEHVEESELDDMEAVMRHCYTGQLGDADSEAPLAEVEQLLRMVLLADRCAMSLVWVWVGWGGWWVGVGGVGEWVSLWWWVGGVCMRMCLCACMCMVSAASQLHRVMSHTGSQVPSQRSTPLANRCDEPSVGVGEVCWGGWVWV